MRKTTWIRSALALLLAMLMMFAVVACAKPETTPGSETKQEENANTPGGETKQEENETPKSVEKKDAWVTATYLTDTEFGSGAKTLKVKVEADGQSVMFTIHSDKQTVGAALLEFNLIAGDESQYGLYVKTVNGMLADYDVDGYWWAFSKGGELLSTGVDSTDFADGDTFELVKTK